MTKKFLLTVLVALATAAGCKLDPATNARVYQGTCKALAADGKTLELANTEPQLNPIQGEAASFDISTAKVGAAPEPGNLIRVAFLEKEGKLVALKVMNITKQDLRKQ